MTVDVTRTRSAEVQSFDLYHSILSLPDFFGPEKRPTVTLLPVWEDKICLVVPRKADSHQYWVLPQDGILRGDGTIINAALRVLDLELGLKETDISPHRIKPLHIFRNPIPHGRKNGGDTKVHYVVGVPVNHPRNLRVNRSKITGLAWIPSEDVFDAMTQVVAEKRPTKWGGMRASIRSASKRNLISWHVH